MPVSEFNVTVEGAPLEAKYNPFNPLTDVVIPPGGNDWVEQVGFMNTGQVALQVRFNGVNIENVGDSSAEVNLIEKQVSAGGNNSSIVVSVAPGQSAVLAASLGNNQSPGETAESVTVGFDHDVMLNGVKINPDGTPIEE